MIVKEGVQFSGITAEILRALAVAEATSRALGFGALVVTSCKDGEHKKGSKHYTGEAFDFRTRHLSVPDARRLVREIDASLGAGYDVIYEDPDPDRRDDGEHGHCEWDPK